MPLLRLLSKEQNIKGEEAATEDKDVYLYEYGDKHFYRR